MHFQANSCHDRNAKSVTPMFWNACIHKIMEIRKILHNKT